MAYAKQYTEAKSFFADAGYYDKFIAGSRKESNENKTTRGEMNIVQNGVAKIELSEKGNVKQKFYFVPRHLRWPRKKQLRMNPSKCAFGVSLGKFLGFVVRHRGIEVDLGKIGAIQEMPPPKTLKELKGLQGKLTYIRRFISNLTGKCQPFSHLMKKGVEFVWDQPCQNAVDSIEELLKQPPSTSGTCERTLIGAECNYSPIEKVCLALIFAVQKLRHYCLSHDIILISRADPLKFLMIRPMLSRRLAKWMLLLSEYMITYEPVKSVKGQAVADFLVAHPVPDNEMISDDFPDEQVMMTELPAIALRNVKEKDVVGFIGHVIIYHYGIPKKIITDNGTPFKNRGMKKLCQKFDIQHSFSTPYYPSANGLAKAFNKTIVKILKKTVARNKRDWDEKLQEALWAYRTTHHTVTKATPYSLVYGVEADIPIETQVASLRIVVHQSITDDENAKIRKVKHRSFKRGDMEYCLLKSAREEEDRIVKNHYSLLENLKIHKYSSKAY
ncbi:uncharacterized protein LOC131217513 [Magnolia sinica]|uniref:uncharacterized protein LOC131217513 n=1 Tax=Magnolia sinica TaxID=86752 RepID=UPI00265A63F6|nr:uncharacterized protein LOC131217513 [Magnolia sinica]